MKKIFLILLLLFSLDIVFATSTISKYSTPKPLKNTLDKNIKENIDVDSNNIKKVINLTYTIPKYYDNDVITIVPSLSEILNNINSIYGDGIKINLKVVNNSNYDYEYRDYSFFISTLDNQNMEKLANTFGFDNQEISKDMVINRTVNSAIQDLYGNENVTSEMLNDEMLEKKLKILGYKGIEELDKFYLDYYNLAYNLNCSKLEDFDSSIITIIFSGNDEGVLETNKSLIELGYNYFYNELYSFHFDDTYNYKNSDLYSIGSYMRDKEKSNPYFKEAFKIIKSNDYSEIKNMKLRINGPLITNAFKNIKLNTYMELKLDKIVEDIYPNDIIPPKTGI